MKTRYLFVLLFSFIFGVYILFHSLSKNPSLSLASDPVVPTITPTISLVPTGISPPKTNQKTQVVTASYSLAFGLQPNTFTVKSGIPVRLEVAAKDDGQGCMGSIMIPQLAPRSIQFFNQGQTNVFEFTAPTPGTYQITCAMGVPHGTITVE